MTKATKESYADELGSLFGDLAKDDDALATFSDNDLGETKDWVPTLIPALDKNLVAGIPASGEISEMYGAPSTGKGHTLDTTFPTPEGKKTLADLSVGDELFDRDGKPTTILGIYPRGKMDVYEVTLGDGRKVRVNDDHIWSVSTSRGNFKNKTTRELIDAGVKKKATNKYGSYQYNFYIPMNKWVNYPKQDIKLDPYVLGALLGDGCLTENALTISSIDEFVVNKISDRLPVENKATNNPSQNYSWGFLLPEKTKDGRNKWVGTTDTLDGVLSFKRGKTRDKYIPDEYLYNTKKVRLELAQGLFDTDGSVAGNKGHVAQAVWTSVNPTLASQFASLLRSLGLRVTLSKQVRKAKNETDYVIVVCGTKEQLASLFTLPRHLEKLSACATNVRTYSEVAIKSIEKLPEQDDIYCLYVDNLEHLYLVEDYIVTHNTTFSGMLMHNAQKMGIVPVYFDVETTQSASRLKELGVDPRYVMTVKPKRLKDKTMMPLYIEDIGQKMIEIAAKIHDRDKSLITMFVWDSVAMTQPKMAAESDLDQQLVGQQAKALAVIGRKLQVNLAANNAFLLAFNQARDDFNAPNPKYAVAKTVGGKGWNHLLSTQILLKKGAKIKAKASDKEAIGQETKVTITKSKIGDNATDEVTIDLLGATGFDAERNLIVSANDLGLVEGSNWMTYITDNGEKIKLQGKIAWTEYLKTDEASEVRTELWQKVLLTYFPKCYPPLFNLHARLTVDKFPEIKGLRKYYSDIQEQLPEDEQDYNYRTYMKAGLPLD